MEFHRESTVIEFYLCFINFATDPLLHQVLPNSQLVLSIPQPAEEGSYQEITWYKGSRTRAIAMYHPDLVGNDVIYFGEFCDSDLEVCASSEKGAEFPKQ